MKKIVLLLMAVVLLFLETASSALATDPDTKVSKPYWMDLTIPGDEDVYCIAANSDNTRFLVTEKPKQVSKGVAFNLFIFDTQTNRKTSLHLFNSPLTDLLVDRVLQFLIKDPKNVETFIAEEGGKENFALRFMWERPYFFQSSVSGDRVLLFGNLYGNLLLDMKTGEITPLPGITATFSQDGTVAICNQEEISLYDPIKQEYTVFSTEGTDQKQKAAQRLSDGSIISLLQGSLDELMTDTTIAFYAPNGALMETLFIGKSMFGKNPDKLLYNEQSGIGITYNMQNIFTTPIYIFRKGMPTAHVLLIKDAKSPYAEEGITADFVDNLGKLAVSNACMAIPIGMTESGNGLVLMEQQEGNLLYLDLSSLDVQIQMNADELAALYRQRGTEPPMAMIATFTMLGWNGKDLFCGFGLPQRALLCVPMPDSAAAEKSPW